MASAIFLEALPTAKGSVATEPTIITDFEEFSGADDAYDLNNGGRQQHRTFSTSDGIDVIGEEIKTTSFGGWITASTGQIVKNQYFKRIIFTLILFNTLIILLSTFDFGEHNSILRIIRRCLQCLFTVEVLLKLIHYNKTIWQAPWTILDVIFVTSSWIASCPSLLVFRTFRILKSLRHVSRYQELRFLGRALQRAYSRAMGVLMLLTVMLYCFAVIFTGIFKDQQQNNDENEFKAFYRLDVSFWTMIQIMTLDQWAQLCRQAIQVHPFSWTLFLAVFYCCTIIACSLLVGVLVESILSERQAQIIIEKSPHSSSTLGNNNNNSNNSSSTIIPIMTTQGGEEILASSSHGHPMMDATLATSSLETKLLTVRALTETLMAQQQKLEETMSKMAERTNK